MSQTDDSAELEQLSDSGLFDGAWYMFKYPDVRDLDLEPLAHFCRVGWRECRMPNRYFDPAWYLENNADIRAAGINPLLHYLRHGDGEGRRPIGHFDPAWYRAAYEIPADANALAHFLVLRTSGCFAPEPELWSVLHIAPYRDDPDAGDDPFAHYLDDMQRDGREPLPDRDVLAASGLIDAASGYFDTDWYVQTNPLVARLKINPLVHYILAGEIAGRRPVPYFDPPWYRVTYRVPANQLALTHYLAHRNSQVFSPTPLFDVGWYVERHRGEIAGDPFAHYLEAGTCSDLDPSPGFNAAEYRRCHLGRASRQFRRLMHPERDNPLVHHLRAEYR